MIVYRIEKDNITGPYRHNELYDNEGEIYYIDRSGSKRHPCPHYDIKKFNIIPNKEKYLFGFKTLDALFNWFNVRERKILKKCAYAISEYKIDKKYVVFGSKQLAFYYDKSKRINRYDIPTYFTKKWKNNVQNSSNNGYTFRYSKRFTNNVTASEGLLL